MKNTHTKWRIDFAQTVAQQFKERDGIAAIVVAGSTARGWADEYSDLELPVFWDRVPDDQARIEIAQALEGDFLFGFDGPSHEDQLLIGKLQVDLWHIPLARQEGIIRDVLNGQRSDLEVLNALDTVRSCIPLFGQEIVQGWKKQAEQFPDPLAKRIIEEQLPSFSIGELFLHAQRGNPTAFFGQLAQLQQKVFLVLLALNSCYFPTFKWIYQCLEGLELKPPDIADRFQKAFRCLPQEAIADTRRALEETLLLVNESYPAINTHKAHRKISYHRTALDANNLPGLIW